MLIASWGQTSTQTPQSIQTSASTAALPSTRLMALFGHSSTQDSQPLHFCLFNLAGIYQPFQKYNSGAAGKESTKCYKTAVILQAKFCEIRMVAVQNRPILLLFVNQPQLTRLIWLGRISRFWLRRRLAGGS